MGQTESLGFLSADLNSSIHKEDPQWAVTRSGEEDKFTAPKKNKWTVPTLKEN